MKYEIMLRILFELLSKNLVTSAYLSNKYDISRRTVYRYIEQIELAGVPIYTQRGQNGGFMILDSFKLSAFYMTKPELDAILTPLDSLNKQVPNKTLDSAIMKLRSIKKKGTFDVVKTEGLMVDASPWLANNNYGTKLSLLVNAINDNLLVEITYNNRNHQSSKRIIEPHVLVLKQGLWYVFAYCRLKNDFRFFKVGRIAEAVAKTEKFNKHYDKERLPFEKFFEEQNNIQIKLEIDKEVLGEVEEWLGIDSITKQNKSYIVDITLPNDNSLVEKIMSYGNKIKVISPKQLQQKIVDTANSIIKAYN